MKNCVTLPPQANGNPNNPCIPEYESFALILGFAALIFIALKKRLR